MLSTHEFPSASEQTVTARLGNLLDEYGEITTVLPVLIGLFVTNQLKLRGSQALLVNLAIAAVARQVVTQLKRQAHPASEIASEPSHENSQNTPSSSPKSAEDYLIVHSVPGRIRLRIPRLMLDAIYAKRLEKLLQAEDMVLGVRVNRSASSLAIQYDGAGLSELELGLRLLQILEQAEQLTTNSVSG